MTTRYDADAFQNVKSLLKQLPGLSDIKRGISKAVNRLDSAPVHRTHLDIVTAFPLYTPGSTGKYEDLAELTIESINQIFPSLSRFLQTVLGKSIDHLDVTTFPVSSRDLQAAEELKNYLDKYGSDKAQKHNYHKFYGPALRKLAKISAILEVGIGTNYENVVSNMGAQGRPGASLRAFRDFLPETAIFGADVDSRVLFEEWRIKTYHVDQRDQRSLDALGELVPPELDLIIDDGLHAPNANINTLIFGLNRIKVGGWFVVEDVPLEAIPLWEVIAALLPSRHQAHLFRAATIVCRDGRDFLDSSGVALFAINRLF